ncbi:MAG: HIT family protein [Solirubrobacterales bacterium]
MDCIFCDYIHTKDKIIAENELAFAIYDTFPVNTGHTLIIPKRHFKDYFEATPDEIKAIYELTHTMKRILDDKFKPDAYNIGVNIGEAAGQTVMHLHVHMIPRFIGDIKNPRGGIRKMMKNMVHYDG